MKNLRIFLLAFILSFIVFNFQLAFASSLPPTNVKVTNPTTGKLETVNLPSSTKTTTNSTGAKTTTNTKTTTSTKSSQPTGYAGSNDVIPSIDSPVKATSIPQLINRVIRILFLFIAMAATIMIVYSGFQLVTSQGSEAIVKTARMRITWSIIGLVVALMSYAIVGIIYNLV